MSQNTTRMADGGAGRLGPRRFKGSSRGVGGDGFPIPGIEGLEIVRSFKIVVSTPKRSASKGVATNGEADPGFPSGETGVIVQATATRPHRLRRAAELPVVRPSRLTNNPFGRPGRRFNAPIPRCRSCGKPWRLVWELSLHILD